MTEFQEALGEHFTSSATTICHCWIVSRNDGVRIGFTDHDTSVSIEGITCQAVSGFHPTQASQQLGLSVDDQQIEGVLDGEALTEGDLLAGLYDNASVEVWMVNWNAPQERFQSRLAFLGEVSQKDGLFEAELRGLTSVLEKNVGRSYLRQCDAILGDADCGVDVSKSEYRFSGIVGKVLTRKRFLVSELDQYPRNWFAFGKLKWTSGENVGRSVDLDSAAVTNNTEIIMWEAMPSVVNLGDQFTLTVGCNKTFETCKSKFANQLNFRGCPHIPGQDFVLGYANSSDQHDGSALIK